MNVFILKMKSNDRFTNDHPYSRFAHSAQGQLLFTEEYTQLFIFSESWVAPFDFGF